MDRVYKSLSLNNNDVSILRNAESIILVSLFAEGKRPRGQIHCISKQQQHIVTTGARIEFITPTMRDTEPKVQCLVRLNQINLNGTWQLLTQLLQPEDQITLLWQPDSHTCKAMLQHGIHGDSVSILIYRDENLYFFTLLEVWTTNQQRPIGITTLPNSKDLYE